nr:hypothetical protein [Tanacetum cinerariifolium]
MQEEEKESRVTKNATWVSTSSATSSSSTSRTIWSFKSSWSFWILPSIAGNAGADEQLMPSPVVHAGSDHEHMDLDVADVSPQPSTEQMDEGFTATAYLKVQENLKLTVKEQVLLEEPASSSGTLSSLQHLSKDLIFGDLFFSDKPLEAKNDKATTKIEVESMVSVTIQQDMSSIPPMTSPIIDLTSRPESPKVHQQLKATATDTTTTTLPPPPYQQ